VIGDIIIACFVCSAFFRAAKEYGKNGLAWAFVGLALFYSVFRDPYLCGDRSCVSRRGARRCDGSIDIRLGWFCDRSGDGCLGLQQTDGAGDQRAGRTGFTGIRLSPSGSRQVLSR